jgi:hypothetical protein
VSEQSDGIIVIGEINGNLVCMCVYLCLRSERHRQRDRIEVKKKNNLPCWYNFSAYLSLDFRTYMDS